MPQTLLLADDSATIQRVIELTFAGEDIKVISVSDGDQAIARLDSAPPDIVLADVGMPGKNGYEVAEYVRRTPALAHIPVVLLTGAFEPVDQAKAAAVGCAGVLAKPFEPQIVIGRVRELLGRSASASAVGIEPASARQAPAADPFAFAPAPPPAPAEVAVGAAPEAKVEDYFDRLDAAFATLSNAPASAAPVSAAPLAAAPPVPDELDWLRPKTDAAQVPEPQDLAIADPFAATPAIAAPDVFAEPEPEPEPEVAVASAVVAAPEVAFEPEVAAQPKVAAEPKIVAAPPVLTPIPIAKFEPEPPAPAPIPVAKVAPEPPPPAPIPVAKSAPPEPREPGAARVLPTIADAFATILAAEQNALGVRPEWPAPSTQAIAAAAPAAAAELVITDDLIDRVARRVLEQLSDRVVRETVASIASDAAERLVKEEIERIKASIK